MFIGQVERGRCNISLHNILKIAAGLELDPGELVRGLEAPESSGCNDGNQGRNACARPPSPPASKRRDVVAMPLLSPGSS
jgi:transcriptional regulator with XRE-family HTH domain